MLKCPYCKTDLGKLHEFPQTCPHCGKSLMTSDDAHASVQLVSDSAQPPGSQCDSTIDSADSSLFPGGAASSGDSADDPSLGQTVQSGELAGADESPDDRTLS